MSLSAGVHSFSGHLGFLAKPKPVVLIWSLSPNSGMSEIRDRAQAAPAKSRKFRDNGLPVSG